MRMRLKSALAVLLSFCFACAAFGCGGYDLKEVELPHYSYAEDGRLDNYNSKLFYRNDYDVPMGDPTTVYIEEGEYAGWFYSTGTTSGNSFDIFRSKDFINWEVGGAGFIPAMDNFGKNSFWAPQLIYDKDAVWADYNVRSNAGESGKGLYFLFYSARTDDFTEKYWKATTYLGVAVSKDPGGPYTEYTGVNKNNDYLTSADPVFDLRNIDPETGINLDENAEPGQELYKKGRGFIDACPYIDPVTGDKYLYMVRTRKTDDANEIWGVKMKDWVSPDYNTVTRLTSFGYTTTDRDEAYALTGYSMKIDEGPFCYYKDGVYYMTFSVGSTDDKLYPVMQATGESPLGPFTKVQPRDGGAVCSPAVDWDIHSSGHHSFFEVKDELWIVYHSYEILGADGKGARAQSFERVQFYTNAKGQTLMHANGPTKVIQPLPEAVSGYKNVAPLAEVKATGAAKGSSAAYLNDALIPMHADELMNDNIPEFEAKGNTEIKLSFSDYVTVRAIMIYNSLDYTKIFSEIDRIEFSYKNAAGETGIAYIENLGFNLEANMVPLDYLLTEEEMEDIDDSWFTMRAGGAAVAEFNELSVNEIKIKIKKGKDKNGLNVADIVVLGKTA